MFPGDSIRDLFYPLVEGHQQPFKRVTEIHHPKKVTNNCQVIVERMFLEFLQKKRQQGSHHDTSVINNYSHESTVSEPERLNKSTISW